MKNEGSVASKLGGIIGRGAPFYQIASSAIIAAVSLFYIYTVASQLHLRIYPLVHRVTYYTNFQAYIINEYVDHIILGGLLVAWLAISMKRSTTNYVGTAILGATLVTLSILTVGIALDAIALASLPVIAAFAIFSAYVPTKNILKNLNSNLILNYIPIVAAIAGTVTLIYAILGVATGNPPQTIVRSYAYDIFLIFSSFSPVLMLLLITCIPVKVIVETTYKYVKLRKSGTRDFLSFLHKEKEMGTRKKIVLLSLIMLLSIIIAMIPHLPAINKDNQQVGVDTGYYVTWINELKKSPDFNTFLYQAFVNENRGDRPLTLVLFYVLSQLSTSELFLTIEYVPFILGPALVLAIYFLAKELTSNDVSSLIAALMTVVSYQTLIGIYSGFYANWLALILGYLSFVFLFRYLKEGAMRNLTLYGVLTVMVLLAHVYTWSILSIVAGLFLIVTIMETYRMANVRRKNAMMLLAVLIATLILDIGRTNIIGASGGIEGDLKWANTLLVGPDQFLLRWNNLSYTTTTFVGGLFANFIVLGLGLYWLIRTRLQENATIFLLIFLSIGILPFLIGEWVIQTRVFYNIPFQIPAAIGLTYLIQEQTRKLLRPAAILLWLVTVAIIAVSNFYLIAP